MFKLEGKLLLSIFSTTFYFLTASQRLAFSFGEARRFAKQKDYAQRRFASQ
jgi:hypothetical protein